MFKLRKTLDEKDLTPKQVKFISAYITSGGNQTIAGRAIGVGKQRACAMMKEGRFKKKVRRIMRRMGLTPQVALRPLIKILKKKGDYHYDFNKLRAVDIYCRLYGLYAPKQLKHSGHIDHTKTHKIDATFKLLKLLKVDYGPETRTVKALGQVYKRPIPTD